MIRKVLLVLCFCGTVSADEIHVPGDFAFIQDAILAANNGDVVVVGDGVWTGFFNTDLDTVGKAITVRSANGNTTIDCEFSSAGFILHSGESRNTVIDGFVIVNGDPGIDITTASPTIRNCEVLNGIEGLRFSSSHSPLVINLTASGNIATGIFVDAQGGAVPEFIGGLVSDNAEGGVESINSGELVLRNMLIRDNTEFGLLQSTQDTVMGCTFVGNENGIIITNTQTAMRNLIVWGNGTGVTPKSTADIQFSDIQGGHPGFGNIDIDPLFDADGWHLLPDSLCIDHGDPDFEPKVGETDRDGDDRVLNGRVDMGVDEFSDFGVCGDGNIDPNEECDPPDGDECDENCMLVANGDADGDGVPNGDDVCDNTPIGVPVDEEGRPLADFDQDCDVDFADFAIFQDSFTGAIE